MTGIKGWFDEHGWAKADANMFGWDIPDIVKHFDDVMEGRYETGRAPHGVQHVSDQLVKVSNAWWADEVIASVVQNKMMAQLARVMLGVDELYLWADSLYWKPPYASGEQSQIGWHQDKQYWGVSSTDKMITACIALYPAGPKSGGLRFADGSNRWGLVGGTDALTPNQNAAAHGLPAVPPGERWCEVCPELDVGGVTFHHCLTFHGSGPNWSGIPRRSITVHMVAGEGRLVNWKPVPDGQLETVGLGNPFRGPLFPRLA